MVAVVGRIVFGLDVQGGRAAADDGGVGMKLTPEEDAALEKISAEMATAMIDALFSKIGWLDEPTNQMGRGAYAKVTSKDGD